MKKLVMTALLGLSMLNCASVTSGQPTTNSVNGDTWYTKDHYLLTRLLTTDSDVYWCPKESPSKCTKAELQDH